MKHIISKQNRALLSEMIRTDFKLRYQGSVLGYLWSLLKPLMLFAILYVVFTQFLRIGRGVPNYPVSLLLGIVLWNFFAEATSSTLKSVVAKGSLLRKISIPRWLVPVASVASSFINLGLNLIVVFIFILFADNTPISIPNVLLFSLLLFELVLVSLAVGFFLSAMFVRYRDIEHIWEVFRQGLFYGTPIIYPLSLVGSELAQKLLLLNPLAQIIQNSRALLTYSGTLTPQNLYTNPLIVMVPFIITVLMVYISATYFRARSKHFAEEV